MLPPPVDPASVARPTDAVARLALSAAWRLRALAHALAHGLRRAPSSHHRAVCRRIDALLQASDAFLAVDALAKCGEDPDRLVLARLADEPLPQPESWAETSLADVLHGGAMASAIGALRKSSEPSLAHAAAVGLGESFGAPVLAELAAHEPNRACLQMLVDRWATNSCVIFGRPGSAADADLVARNVKARPSGAALLAWLAEIEGVIGSWGSCLPDAELMGIEVEGGWTPARRLARRP
jgi:1,2-phenylacetyl-CoA epoxidase catalytic subunit